MTAIDSPIPLSPMPQSHRGAPVDDFVARLSHPPAGKSTNALTMLAQCLLSFGLLPLLINPTRWAEFVDTERHDLVDLAGWWRRRVDAAEARKLDKIVSRLRPRPFLMVLPWLAVAFNFVLMVTLLLMGDDLGRLWDLTFAHRLRSDVLFNDSPLHYFESHLYRAWIATLCVAYGCQWYAVRSHVVAVNALVQWTNKLARENRFAQIETDPLKIGMHPLWLVVGIGMAVNQIWWAIPMIFTGAMQRCYSTRTSQTVRVSLAAQARSGFAVVQSRRDRFCSAGHCGARLPKPAKFCPRCGTAV